MSKISLKIAVIFLGIIFLCAHVALAESLPLPLNTRVLREETVETGGQDKKVVFCESDLTEKRVISFYRKRLQRMGYTIFMQQDKITIYLKGEDIFMVLVGPSGGSGKTSFILTKAKNTIPDIGGFQDCKDIPSVPVYPDAQCMSSMRMKSGKVDLVKYSVAVEVDQVANFYRIQMVQNGWSLEQDRRMGDALSAAKLSDPAVDIDVKLKDMTLLDFKNSRNERCMVTLMPITVGMGTLINISYEEKK